MSTYVKRKHLLNDQIDLHRGRKGSDPLMWYCRFKFNGKWKDVTTRIRHNDAASDAAFREACRQADSIYSGHTDNGTGALPYRPAAPPPELQKQAKTFGEAADNVIERLDVDLKKLTQRYGSGTKLDAAKRPLNNLRNIIKPAFGHLPLTAITRGTLERFLDDWEKTRGKRCSKSTVGNYSHVYRMVMEWAQRNDWLAENHIFPNFTKKRILAGKRFSTFSYEEMDNLLHAMSDRWVKEPPKRVSREAREILRHYVVIAASTGIRPGTEMSRLRWKHVDEDFKKDGALYVMIQVPPEGKIGRSRNVIGHEGGNSRLRSALRALRAFKSPNTDSDDFLFTRPSDGKMPELNYAFRELLNMLNFLVDPIEERNRVLYSLRHFYATMQIGRGVAFDKLAVVMGTSVSMIEKHYNHSTAIEQAQLLAGKVDKRERDMWPTMADPKFLEEEMLSLARKKELNQDMENLRRASGAPSHLVHFRREK
jgi:hypothetical protein